MDFWLLLNHFRIILALLRGLTPALYFIQQGVLPQEGGSIDIEVSFEISKPVAAIFAEKMLATRRKEEYSCAAQFCSQ